ncbi:hypothetical protein LZF95_01665 [Algoriphagus sp. AGSA1]|uniref:hypothetical protein n=1 Tax=Algoriphagus sp. AGSA1 TaxID=2907213 RepID=UPI001F22B315|nr:hypothetical protein [Algoriphagus sp. AGSA1]MCE7053365.1 hypothetical protein [Algoriphagus sp. AGSA1]
MNLEQLRKDIFPSELILKLYRDIPNAQYEEKIKLVNDYIDEVQDIYDEDVLKIKKHNQIAFCYWMAEQYPLAIQHFEMVVENMEPEDYPHLYFLALNLLIRGNRILSNYEIAEKWAELAWENHHLAHAISNLHILNDYTDVITETKTILDKKYYPLIRSIIDEYGFPEELEDPVKTIRSMNQRHKLWSIKYGEIVMTFRKSDHEKYIRELEQFIDSCEIEWYRNYAEKTVERLKKQVAHD